MSKQMTVTVTLPDDFNDEQWENTGVQVSLQPDSKVQKEIFIESLRTMADYIHANNVEKGFWEPAPSTGEVIALIHSELSEALEADRKGLDDDHLPDYPGLYVELADAMIRILDYCGACQIDIGQIILEKVEYNKSRPHEHGKAY